MEPPFITVICNVKENVIKEALKTVSHAKIALYKFFANHDIYFRNEKCLIFKHGLNHQIRMCLFLFFRRSFKITIGQMLHQNCKLFHVVAIEGKKE